MDYQAVLIVLAAFLFSCSGQYSRDYIEKTTLKTRNLPNLDTCGLPDDTFEPKIINGKPADLGAFPWMTNLGYVTKEKKTPKWLCGGSLITNRYILTAAHCVDPNILGKKGYDMRVVRLGELDLNDTAMDEANPVDYEVETYHMHERYSNALQINDIALVRTKKEIEFTAFIRPICLPSHEFQVNDFIGSTPYIAGWGKSIDSFTRAGTKLLQAEVEVKNTSDCRANYTMVMKNAIIDKNVLCASSPGVDSCQGDSGGPLMLYRKANTTVPKMNMYLLGIVSYGYGCALEEYPGVYTRVVEFMNWIIDTMDI